MPNQGDPLVVLTDALEVLVAFASMEVGVEGGGVVEGVGVVLVGGGHEVVDVGVDDGVVVDGGGDGVVEDGEGEGVGVEGEGEGPLVLTLVWDEVCAPVLWFCVCCVVVVDLPSGETLVWLCTIVMYYFESEYILWAIK